MSQYVTLCTTLQSALTTALAPSYAGIVLSTRLFRADRLPDLTGTNYAIILSPPSVPVRERVISVRTLQSIFSVDLFLLVKNFHEENAVFGVAPGALGIFQLIEDVKDALRDDPAVNAVLDHTFEELTGDIQFNNAAVPSAFESSEYVFMHRALQTFVGRDKYPVCY